LVLTSSIASEIDAETIPWAPGLTLTLTIIPTVNCSRIDLGSLRREHVAVYFVPISINALTLFPSLSFVIEMIIPSVVYDCLVSHNLSWSSTDSIKPYWANASTT